MGHNLGTQAHGDTFHALCQQQWKLHGQRGGLALAAVVAQLPLGGVGVEDDIEGKLAEASLDVAGRGGTVAGAHIAPVALGFDEQVLLAEVHHGIADAGIAVRVVLHGLADDVGHLVEAAVVHLLHSM